MQKYLVAFSILVYYFFLISWLLSGSSIAIRSFQRPQKNGSEDMSFLSVGNYLTTTEIEASFNTTYQNAASASLTWVYHFNYTREENETDAIRVFVESGRGSAMEQYPVLVVVKQQLGVLSWQIPLMAEKEYPYWTTGRTLCPTINYKDKELEYDKGNGTVYQNIYIEVSSAWSGKAGFSLRAYQLQDFFLETGQPMYVNVTPSQPWYVEYVMPEGVDRVLVMMEALEPEKYCSYFSVQPIQCPVADLESDLKIQGIYQTVTKKGGIVVTRSQYDRFYVVITVKPVDIFCQNMETIQTPGNATMYYNRVKQVKLTVIETLSTKGYLIAIFCLIGFFLGFYLVTCLLLAGGIINWRACLGRTKEEKADNLDEGRSKALKELEKDMQGDPVPDSEGSEASAVHHRSGAAVAESYQNSDAANSPASTSSRPTRAASSTPKRRGSDSSLESEVDFADDVDDDKQIVRTKIHLHVGDMTMKSRKRLGKKDRQYRWSMITICIFYGLPVAQLLITSQRVLHDTGNDDLCYYNFDCANPLWLIVDFNHVISNVGYVLLGILFILLVRRRQLYRIKKRREEKPAGPEEELGVPPQFELFYAIGVALIMEGLMSASYHICPSYSNFQFDTSFMYLIAGLGILKIYQKRHADVLPNAYMAYAFFAFIILMAVLGVVYISIAVWVLFSVALVIFTTALAAQIYHMTRWSVDFGLFGRVYRHFRTHGVFSRPAHPDRFILLSFVIGINWTLAIVGPILQPMDFASYMLSCFLVNLLLYLVFYMAMKLFHKERLSRLTMLFMLLSAMGWGGSLYLFFQGPIDWQQTPSRSREVNKSCFLLGFYDQHDVWHMISAISLFFSFMAMLTLDDDLLNTARNQIPVF